MTDSMPATTVITLVTSNQYKLRELQQLAPAGLSFTTPAVSVAGLIEPQSLSLRQIVESKLRQAYQLVGGPVIVEDVAAGLTSLKGLPGPFVRFFQQELGDDALYKLSKDPDHDRVTVTCLAGYYDGTTMLFGEGVLTGNLTTARGSNGFGFDVVVVPDDQPQAGNLTMAEMTHDQKNVISHRRLALDELLRQIAIDKN